MTESLRRAYVDVGSNSVRWMFDGDKRLITTRLGGGKSGRLEEAAVRRTVEAIAEFKRLSAERGAEELIAFATAAVRNADKADAENFLTKTHEATGVKVFVVDADTEAKLAVFGALGNSDGAVIDLGGASTEIAVRERGEIIYTCSAGVGAVTLFTECGRDRDKLVPYIAQKTAIYGNVPTAEKVFAVGGTATSLAAYKLKLETYDPKIVHGTAITIDELDALIQKLERSEVSEITRFAVDPKRAEILYGGALLLKSALLATGGESLTVSESDNLEGFEIALSKGDVSPYPCKLQSRTRL